MLDTNAYSALMQGRPEVAERVRRTEQILVSSIVAGELLFGFRNGSRLNENLERFDAFLANSFVSWVPVTLVTADRFSRIAAALRRKGRPLPTNDVWIAAHTLETGADLLSYDRNFEAIDGLPWVALGGDG
jgi:tRNA(fMet)-specific endonuclease VapC